MTSGDERSDEIRPGGLQKVEAFQTFLASLDDRREPTLSFLHVTLPHVPWKYLPSGSRYPQNGVAGLSAEGRWPDHDAVIGVGLQRHLLQLGLVDRLLAELLGRLRALDLHDRCMLVVLADHGASFRPDARRRKAEHRNARDILHVPLFIKLPGQREARVDDRNVESIDILPTIADVLGIELPWEVDGHSVFDDEREPRRTKVLLRPDSDPLVFPDASLPGNWPALRYRARIFGARPGWPGIAELASRPGMAGRDLRDFPRAAAVAGSVSLVDEQGFAVVGAVAEDGARAYVPAYVRGRIQVTPPAEPPGTVAIAVNGIVRAVADTFEPTVSEASFAVMVSEDAFHTGANEVRVLAVTSAGELAPIETVAYRYIPETAAAAHFERSDGARLEIEPGAIAGGVDVAAARRDHLIMHGWVADLQSRRTVEHVLVVVGDGPTVFSVLAGRITRRLREFRARHPELPASAFKVTLPLELIGDPRQQRVRVFGVSAGRGLRTRVRERRELVPGAMMRRIPRLLLNLGLAAALLLGMEGLCRLSDEGSKYRDSDLFGYELAPGYDSGHERVSAAGLRGPELRPRDDVRVRILCMGGSTTWGHKVDEDETWPHELERALGAAGREGVEVLNGGVSGWGLEQIVLSLDSERLDVLRPDLVLVYSGWNHATLADNPQIAEHVRGHERSRSAGGLYRSAFVRWLAKRVEDWRPAPAEPVDRVAQRVARRATVQRVMEAAFPDLCRRLAEACARRGVPVAMIRYPGLMQLPPPADGSRDERYERLLKHDDRATLPFAEHARLAEQQWRQGIAVVEGAARAAGLPVLDLSTRLEAGLPDDGRRDQWESYFRDRMHLTPAGNAAAGAALAELLVEAGLL